MPLKPHEIDALRDSVIFPAVDYLVHDNFTGSEPDNQFSAERIIARGDEPRTKVSIEAFVWLKHLDDDDMDIDPPERCVSVNVSVQQQTPEMTDSLVLTAKNQDGNEATLADDSTFELSAWTVHEYYFSTNHEDSGVRQSYLELQDEEGGVVWSETSACVTNLGHEGERVELTTAEIAALDALDEEESTIEIADRTRIREALGVLGVPQVILLGQSSN